MTSALWILVDALVGIPSLGLYVFILGTLCDRHYKRLYFHSSFYRLVTLTAIVEIGFYCTYSVVVRLPLNPYAGRLIQSALTGGVNDNKLHTSRILSSLNYLYHGLFYAQFMVKLLLVLNRFSACLAPKSQEDLWDTFHNRAILVGGCLSFFLPYYLLFEPTSVWPLGRERSAYRDVYTVTTGNNGTNVMWDSPGLPMIVSVFLLAGVFANLVTMSGAILRYFRGTSNAIDYRPTEFGLSIPLSVLRERDKNASDPPALAVFTFVVYLLQLGSAGFQYVLYHRHSNVDSYAAYYVWLPWMLDLCTMSTPWLLVAFSAAVRYTILPSRVAGSKSVEFASLRSSTTSAAISLDRSIATEPT